METLEYRTMDKSNWGFGPWQDEPDKKQWFDKETGYPCLIVRNDFGALCGYVGIPEDHPFYNKGYDEVYDAGENIEVHGGLTFADFCHNTGDEKRAICHIGDDKPWWFGFDCAHYGDIAPKIDNEMRKHGISSFVDDFWHYSYKDFSYVTAEVERLAKQLKELN